MRNRPIPALTAWACAGPSLAGRLRSGVVFAPCVLLLAGCGHDPAQADDAQNRRPASSPTVDAPTSSRAGSHAPVVWRGQPRASAPAHTTHGPAIDSLTIGEIRADNDRVYFDIVHKAASGGAKHDGAPAELLIRTNRCTESKGRLAGAVWRDWTAPSTVSASLVDLPDGELDLTVRAFGAEQSLSFLKRGRRFEALTPEKRAGYLAIPADPAHGIPQPLAGLVVNPCKDEVTP